MACLVTKVAIIIIIIVIVIIIIRFTIVVVAAAQLVHFIPNKGWEMELNGSINIDNDDDGDVSSGGVDVLLPGHLCLTFT